MRAKCTAVPRQGRETRSTWRYENTGRALFVHLRGHPLQRGMLQQYNTLFTQAGRQMQIVPLPTQGGPKNIETQPACVHSSSCQDTSNLRLCMEETPLCARREGCLSRRAPQHCPRLQVDRDEKTLLTRQIPLDASSYRRAFCRKSLMSWICFGCNSGHDAPNPKQAKHQ